MNTFDLESLDFENVSEWPLPIKIVAIVIACIGLLFAGYSFSTKTQLAELKEAQEQEQTLKEEYLSKHGLAVNLSDYKLQLAEMKVKFGSMLRQLPDKNEVPNLVEDISKIGSNVGLGFTLIKPADEIQREFYVALPIKISVTGSYHQIAYFVSRVANMPRIVTLRDFSIKLPDQKSTRDTTPADRTKLNMEITAQTYRYVTEGGGQ